MYTARCKCGNVKVKLSWEIADRVTCSCNQCKQTYGKSWEFVWFWDKDIEVIWKENLESLNLTQEVSRKFCKHCKAHIIWKDVSDIDKVTYILRDRLEQKITQEWERHIYKQ